MAAAAAAAQKMTTQDELSKRYLEERRILFRGSCSSADYQHQFQSSPRVFKPVASSESCPRMADLLAMTDLHHHDGSSSSHQLPLAELKKNHRANNIIACSSSSSSSNKNNKMIGRRRTSAPGWSLSVARPAATVLLASALLFVALSCSLLVASQATTGGSQIQQASGGGSSAAAAAAAASAGQTEQQQQPVAMARTNDNTSNNVILIKYANVSSSADESSSATATTTTTTSDISDEVQAHELKVFQLSGPLTVSVIESKFAHSIKLFDVSQNQLSTLSKDLFCPLADTVRRLNVSHNLVDNFDCIGLISQAGQLCLSQVRVLDMSFNLIKHLPATGVATLHNLEILNLSNNLIESLDELALTSLFKLTRLDLSHNRLQQLPMKIFHKSSSMQVLKLQSNSLQSIINQQLLAGLSSLEELNLSHNNISHVSDQAFIDKVNLTLVDLRFNQLGSLRQDALRVTLVKQTSVAFRHRLHHNGQYAGVAPKQTHSLSAGAEILLASNPFVCDCQLEWMRKFQQPGNAIRQQQQSVLSAPYGDHHNHYQNDQAPVMPGQESTAAANISSEINPSHQQQQAAASRAILHQPTQMVNLQSSGQQQSSSGHHYARIGDLNLVRCTPLLRRNAHRNSNHISSSGQQQQLHRSLSAAGHLRSLAPPDGGAQRHTTGQQPETMMIDLLSADSSNFLCRYKSHCFALCQCCEFDACDCEMICPNGCNCYYDSTWQTNIIDCSASNHTVVPDRIPMDVSSLSLDGNNIGTLKPSNLIARKSLRTLYLNSSNLHTIYNRSFNGLIELQTLYLQDNQLRTLHGYEFEPLSQLRALYLQSNRLDHVNNQTFIYLRSLEILDLSNNRLTQATSLDLFMSIGHHNIRLRQLSIAHNWWSCQCSEINRFRQILRQKFPLSGGVNIVDKNQLRCYYSNTTVGPSILGPIDGVAASAGQPLGAPIYATYSSSSLGNRQQQQLQQQQQQLLTEINQCSEVVDKLQEIDINPPRLIEPSPPADLSGLNSPPANDYPASDPMFGGPELAQQPNPNNPFNPLQQQQPSEQQQQQQPFDPSNPIVQPPLGDQISQQQQQQQPMNARGQPKYGNMNNGSSSSGGGIPLTSLVLLSILFMSVMIIAVSIFLFVRQQQRYHHQNHHKKSSAASTTSVSSSASSAAISSLNGKSHRHHHHHQQQQQHLGHHTMHHHQLIMSNGGQATTTSIVNHHLQQQQQQPIRHQHHHQHSASSQSNIYAALVPPASGQSTTLASNHHHPSNNNNNNLYSNSSSAASHHSSSSHNLYPASQQQQQTQWQSGSNQQHSIYHAHPYGANIGENQYTIGGGGASQASYKTGSLYNAASHCHAEQAAAQDYQQQQQQPALPNDWIKLPKVKQFVSKLVNKSLALGGYRSCSRDELAALASDKIYDAFISYDKRDESFVMQKLSVELEYGQPQYRIADRFRDLPLPTSAYISEAITSVIGCSHRTIIVLTRNYLSSDWCRFELQAALHECSLDKSHKIIAVVVEAECLLEMDNEMRALLTHNNVPIYCSTAHSQQPAQLTQQQQQPAPPQSNYGQLVQLEGSSPDQQQQQQQQQLVATLMNQSGGNQQVSTQAASQLASSRITFINYNERKFWPKLKQLMPQPRPSTQALTLTTKN